MFRPIPPLRLLALFAVKLSRRQISFALGLTLLASAVLIGWNLGYFPV